MYEEKRFIRKRINWVSVFLKLLLLLLIVFLIWFLIYKHKNGKDTVKGNSMTENLTYLKKQSIRYFNEDNLPKYINGQTKVSLDDLIKSGASKKIVDKDGNECSNLSSYSQVTKIDNKNYNLKVYIKCKNEADSILTAVSKDTFINNKLDTNKKSTSNKNTNSNNNKNTNTNNSNKNTNTNTNNSNKNANTSSTNTNKNTNATNSNSTNSKTTTTNSSKKNSTTTTNKSNSNNSKTTTSKNNKSTSVSVNNSTTTNTSKTQTTSSTRTSSSTSTSTSSSSTSSSSTSSSSSSSSTSSTVAYVPTEDKLLYTEYKLIKYGDAQWEKPMSGKYLTRYYTVTFNRYCYGHDHVNCHVIAKLDKYAKDINYLLLQGYEEIFDHTESKKYYIPYNIIWSKTKDVAGYEYTGDHREIYKMN